MKCRCLPSYRVAVATFSTLVSLIACVHSTAAVTAKTTTFPPMRPLPEPSRRPVGQGSAFFVDAAKGDDRNDGSKQKPWKTIAHALGNLKAGDTLYLRGGVFHERPRVVASGEKGRPITIRGYPGELAYLDGAIPEFLENPSASWEPATNGVSHEYVSKRTFPEWNLGKLQGNFADSMVPLHGYRYVADFRAGGDGIWRLKKNDDPEPGVYLGPGLWFDQEDKRIHIRLAPMKFGWLDEDQNYRGETDPRKIPLVIAGGNFEGMLTIKNARHLRFQDLVLRGSGRTAVVDLERSEDIEFDGLTFFGGSPSLQGQSTKGLRIVNCAFRGLGSAPWESRSSMKYRGKPHYVLVTVASQPMNEDWEIAQSEFTDGHDFALIRWVRNLRFHHNFVDNFNDDGLEFGPRTKDQLAWVYCNRIARCLVLLTQHEGKTALEANPGSGIFVFRNVMDLRQPVRGSPRREVGDEPGKEEGQEIWRTGELSGDHGAPIWCNYYFYQNTVLREGGAWRNHYAFGLGERGLIAPIQPWMEGTPVRSQRRVFNNIFVQKEGLPGLALPQKPEEVDLQVDGNLYWGVEQGPSANGDFFAKLRSSPLIEASKKQYPPGWAVHDLFGDPKFNRFIAAKGKPLDLSLQKKSPAVNAGVPIPADWPDTLRDKDAGKPDIGAIPMGTEAWPIGVNGRLPLFPE